MSHRLQPERVWQGTRTENQTGRFSNEALFGGSGHHGVNLSTLHTAGVEGYLAYEFVNREAFARDSRLVNREHAGAFIYLIFIVFLVISDDG